MIRFNAREAVREYLEKRRNRKEKAENLARIDAILTQQQIDRVDKHERDLTVRMQAIKHK